LVSYRVGIDIGGTFTDLVLAGDDGTLITRKILSTPDDFGRGIVAGLGPALAENGIAPDAVTRLVHGTTVATNAVLEGKGAATALVTTAGFRDVLEMRRLRIPEMYALNYAKPEPLVPRRHRLEVVERMGPDGAARVPLDEASVAAAAAHIAAAGIEAVAVSLLHAYANPEHERRIGDILRTALGDGVFITLSSDILPVIREYERTSTTVINAYLGPILRRYFASLTGHLGALGITAPLEIMKSDGGVMSVAAAALRPAYIVESGPAAGVIGAARMVGGGEDCITLDMGGTTAKAAMVEGGVVARTGDYEVGAGINLSSRLVMGGGYALKLPVIDISEIGAGGGSIVALDAGGLLHVGPQSAGAMPGPVAYDLGGEAPTFTDALVALGLISPDALVGGGLALNAGKARAVLAARIAKPLGKDLLECAWGIFEVACGTMMRAVKAVSTYRGRDPRDFALFAFGGNGPVVAPRIAELLGMGRVIVPPGPGVFSACGLLVSDIEQAVARANLCRLSATDWAALEAGFAALEGDLAAAMAGEGYGAGDYAVLRHTDLRYAGQAHELTIALAPGIGDLDALAEAFGAEHARTYGHRAEAEEVECVCLRVTGRVTVDKRLGRAVASPGASRAGQRQVFFGDGLLATPVVDRAALSKGPHAGPLIVEEYDSTCVVPPGWTARLGAGGSIRLERE
jgi:N-methylhydantoinase A